MRRIAVAATLAALVGTAVVIPGTASYAASGTHFAGTTIIAADRSAREIVDLPRTVHLTYAHGFGSVRGLSIAGPGRVVGLALVSAGRPGDPGFAELRMRSCFSTGCAHPSPDAPDQLLEVDWGGPFPGVGASTAPRGFTLPAGRYQLSVFTDGAPVLMRWRIPGLPGRATLHPVLAQRSSQTSPAEHAVAGTPANPASTQATGTGSVTTDVAVLGFAHLVRGSAHVSDDTWWCIYQNGPPPGGVITQGCPGGDGLGAGGTYVTASYGGLSYGVSVSIGPGAAGSYFQGVDDSGVQVMTAAHDTLFWADAGIPTQH